MIYIVKPEFKRLDDLHGGTGVQKRLDDLHSETGVQTTWLFTWCNRSSNHSMIYMVKPEFKRLDDLHVMNHDDYEYDDIYAKWTWWWTMNDDEW